MFLSQKFDELKDCLNPIPLEDITPNGKYKQNPYWSN